MTCGVAGILVWWNACKIFKTIYPLHNTHLTLSVKCVLCKLTVVTTSKLDTCELWLWFSRSDSFFEKPKMSPTEELTNNSQVTSTLGVTPAHQSLTRGCHPSFLIANYKSKTTITRTMFFFNKLPFQSITIRYQQRCSPLSNTILRKT